MIRFHCPHCDKTLKVPDKKAGTAIVCPRCEGSSLVPEESLEGHSGGRHSGQDGWAHAVSGHHQDDTPSLFSGMSPTLRAAVVLVAGFGVLSLLLSVVLSFVPAPAAFADVAGYGAMTVFPLSVVALLVILYGHGTSCPSCARWWARRKDDTEFVDKEVFEKDGEPFGRSILRTHYGCESCGHRWSVTSSEEYKVSGRGRSKSRLG